ncbi:hypothetical protein [Anaeromyxobacter sp. PSR-1]|uniref:hypothetical protein n=1 Tax=Anaeromyxobacter sp. PSR-1 TaxID=1300915 RepID=UPI0005E6ADBC|nr:hypothetical protein [Anaeromyxobacter sp. PSR-1]GAO04150.1 hypothetical protein PSR1_03038 [Anaeromyxobacter sp. PSR-1]
MSRTTLAVLLALTLGCGGLDSPDLSTGEVQGRILGASAGAYVYPLGRPDLVVRAAAAGDFAYRLALPRGEHDLVLYDGGVRAERVPIEVEGAGVRTVADRRGEGAAGAAAKMPLAGAILAGVRAVGGALPLDPRLDVTGTDPGARLPLGTTTALFQPLPAGRYRLTAEMVGFLKGGADVDVVEGASTPYELELLVDGDEAERGCTATGGCESSALECEDDGLCHDADPSGSACAYTCDGGAPCPAGLDCSGGQCLADRDCATYLSVAGTPCVSDDVCDDALHDGSCRRTSAEQPGYCTAPCQDAGQCAPFGAGWTCDGGLCAPPPP